MASYHPHPRIQFGAGSNLPPSRSYHPHPNLPPSRSYHPHPNLPPSRSYHPHPNLPPSRGKGLIQRFPNIPYYTWLHPSQFPPPCSNPSPSPSHNPEQLNPSHGYRTREFVYHNSGERTAPCTPIRGLNPYPYSDREDDYPRTPIRGRNPAREISDFVAKLDWKHGMDSGFRRRNKPGSAHEIARTPVCP